MGGEPLETDKMIQILKNLFKNDLFLISGLALVQGLLTSLAMEPYSLPTGWVMPWPLFYLAWRFKNSMPMLLLSGTACGLFFSLFSAYWVIGLFGSFAGLGTAASAALFVPFSVLFNLHVPLFLLLFGLVLRNGRLFRPQWLFAGTTALIADYAAPEFFPFSWGNFIAGNPLVQVADLTGAYGLTLLLFMASYFFYRVAGMALARGRTLFRDLNWLRDLARPRALARFLPVPLILLLCLAYGAARLRQIDNLQRSLPVVRTAIINPDAPPEDSRFVTRAVLEKLMSVTIPGLADKAAVAAGPLDLVVLPESAVPFMCAEDTPLTRKIKRYMPEAELMAQLISYNNNVDIFMNETVYRAVPGENNREETRMYNSSVIYLRNGRRGGSYHKKRLLAFGEYMPGEGFFRKIGLYKTVRDIMGSSRFLPGPASNTIGYTARGLAAAQPRPLTIADLGGMGPRAFEMLFPSDRTAAPAGRFLPLICYEALFGDHVRSFFGVPGGEPGFIVNITQDGWYGDTDETYQHFELARLRAVETRRAIVRAVNDGAAGFVDMAGRYVTPLAGPVMTAPGQAAYQVWDVPVNRDMVTFYVIWGDWWIVVFLAGIGVVVAMRIMFSCTSHPPVPRRGHAG